MNTLAWFNFDNTDADLFKIYRSIPGLEFLFSSVITVNPTFRFAATSPDLQELVLDTTNIDAFIVAINNAKGIVASKSTDGLSVHIRLKSSNGQARLKLYSCDLIADLGIDAGTIIVPGLNFSVIGTTPALLNETDPYLFDDADGSELDWYYVTSVKGSKESIPSVVLMPLIPGVNYCVAEARFIDIQGRPVKGVEVTAEPAVLDVSSFAANKITVKSDSYGRVSLPLIQCNEYVIHIPAIGYNQFISVPVANFLDLTQWPATTKPELSP